MHSKDHFPKASHPHPGNRPNGAQIDTDAVRTTGHAESEDLDATTTRPAVGGGDSTFDFSFTEQHPAPSPAALPTIKGYDILRLLGRGGMGVVYLARDLRLQREVAVKMVRPGATVEREDLDRFRSEARAVARLQHPNIIQIFAVGDHDGQLFFALEYLEGGDLRKKLAGQPQPPHHAAEIIETIARAVDEAHQHQLVHRDLKPANILLTKSGTLKVCDFGLVKRLDAETAQTATGAMAGTPNYMAPEQARGDSKSVGPAADTYALGVMLYEALVGRPPFVSSSVMDVVMRVIHDPPIAPRKIDSKIPRDLETICLKCLEKQPEKRYGSAIELAEDLKRFRNGEPIRARPISPPARLSRWCRRKPAHAASILLAVLLLLGGWFAAAAYRVERDRAEENAEVAADTAEEIVHGARHLSIAVNRKLIAQPELDEVRIEILNETLAWLNNLPKQSKLAERAERTTAAHHQQMGELMRDAGRKQEAHEHYQRAFEIVNGLYQASPDSYQHVRNLAASYNNLAELEPDVDERRSLYEKALALRLRWTELQPGSVGARQAVANSLALLSKLSLDEGDVEAAKETALRAKQWWEKIPINIVEADVETNRERNAFYTSLGKVYLHTEDWDAALECSERALQHRLALWKEDPKNSHLIHDTALGSRQVGDCNLLGSRGDLEAARAAYQQSLDRFTEYRDWAADNPRPLHDANRSLAKAHYRLGTAKLKLGDQSGAREDFQRSLELMKSLGNLSASEMVDRLLAAGRCGDFEVAEQTIRQLRRIPSVEQSAGKRSQIACGYALCAWAAMQENWRPEQPAADESKSDAFIDKAFDHLSVAIARGWSDRFDLEKNPELDALRSDPRFEELLDRLPKPAE